MTITCSQCGAVLPSNVRTCRFCESVLSPEPSSGRDCTSVVAAAVTSASKPGGISSAGGTDLPWLGELEQRLDAYRVRRSGGVPQAAQTQLPFGEPDKERHASAVGVADPPAPASESEDFSFTIAIGRYSSPPEKRDGRLEIDVSVPPGSEADADADAEGEAGETHATRYGLYPVASLQERSLAAVIDVACLLFAYGGFLTLFGSLGGQFTLSKLSAEVYAATLAIVYLQYFALFTVFGGTTPGMILRGLQVSSFSGEPPTPRQTLLRTLGYLISAGTLFLGFLWAWWDEDALTWHDRISQTYLTSPRSRAHMTSASMAHSR